jgi:hypothetical protein
MSCLALKNITLKTTLQLLSLLHKSATIQGLASLRVVSVLTQTLFHRCLRSIVHFATHLTHEFCILPTLGAALRSVPSLLQIGVGLLRMSFESTLVMRTCVRLHLMQSSLLFFFAHLGCHIHALLCLQLSFLAVLVDFLSQKFWVRSQSGFTAAICVRSTRPLL